MHVFRPDRVEFRLTARDAVAHSRIRRPHRPYGRKRRHKKTSTLGASIKAPKAPRGCGVRRGVPSPPGRGLGRGLCPLTRIFLIFDLKKLVHSVTDKTYFWSAWRLEFLSSTQPSRGRRSPSSSPSRGSAPDHNTMIGLGILSLKKWRGSPK